MTYQDLINELYRRTVEEDVHPDDASWNVVMEATEDTKEGMRRLGELYQKAGETAENNPAYIDAESSPEAEMQAVILAELRMRYFGDKARPNKVHPVFGAGS